MRTSIASPDYFAGHTVLAKALRDPKVVSLARSMNMDLRDPSTLKDLLKQTKQLIESSTQVVLGDVPELVGEESTLRNAYVSNAVRTYRQIEAMR